MDPITRSTMPVSPEPIVVQATFPVQRTTSLQPTAATPTLGSPPISTTIPANTPADPAQPFATRDDLGQFIQRQIADTLTRTRIDLPYAPAVHANPTPQTPSFSLLRAIGVLTHKRPADSAKYELDLCGRFGKDLLQRGFSPTEGETIVIPFATQFLPDDMEPIRREFMESWAMATAGADGGEVELIRSAIRRRQLSRAYSANIDAEGGVLIPFPQQGEFIELLRKKSALLRAGCRIVPLPPHGRLRYPTQTGAATAYWVGENESITLSSGTTGYVDLIVKKLAARSRVPNELFRYSSPAAEVLFRNDMAEVLALKADLGFLEGTGGTQPKGIINYSQSAVDTTTADRVQLLAASVPAANGDYIQYEDSEKLITAIEEANGHDVTAFVMRPKMHRFVRTRRADAVSAADAKGPFLHIWDRISGTRENWNGIPVVKSTQLSQNRTKGAASNLNYILGGHWPSLALAFTGAMEFASNPYETTSWTNDLTEIRGIMHCDSALLVEEDIAMFDDLLSA